MNLNCETILVYYTHKNKKILCQIKVTQRQRPKTKKTCRSLTQDQWNSFDKKLEKVIANTDDWNDTDSQTFKIKPIIEVKVQKSSLSLKYFKKCLRAIDKDEDDNADNLEEADYILQCLFDFQDETAIDSTAIDSTELDSTELDSQDISLSYEPYTPTKKKYRVDNIDTVKTPGIEILNAQKGTFSPKILTEVDKEDSTVSEEIPNTPVSMKSSIRRSSRESSKSTRSDLLNEVIVETGDEIESPEKDKTSKIKSKEKETKSVDENRRKKHRKRSKTVDDISILCKEKISIDKYKKTKELEDDRSSSKDSRYEHKKLKKLSQSSEELPKLKKIITEENRIKPLEAISESPTNIIKKKKKDSNENISNSKSKTNTKKSAECSSSSSDDDFPIADIKLKESKSRTKTSDDEFEDDCKLNKKSQLKESNDNASNLNISISSATTESATDTSPSKVRKGRKPKENISTSTALRRSERSPSKPLRYTVDITEINTKKKKSKKLKSSPSNKDLFGTDIDEDDDFENNNDAKTSKDKNKIKSSPSVFETPVSKKLNKSASSSSSSSKKRKRDRSSECEQEKRDMSKWLSKKKSTSTDKDTTKTKEHKSKTSSSSSSRPLKTSKKDKKQKDDENTADSRSNSPTPVFEMPSKEELDLIRKKTEITQKENAKLRAELEKINTGPPKEVEVLSLQKMTAEEILNTFSTYKSDLDEIYENNRRRDYIKSHDGINHCFIIRLLQQNVQMKMLEKLTDIYKNTKTSTQATLFANALLPEWVIRVYMDKFKFTRQGAIDQIKAQEEFQLHMEEQSDNSFMFD